MTRKKASYYLRRIYRLLDDEDAVLKLKKYAKMDIAGEAHVDEKEMIVDPRQDLAAAIVHEALHILYGNLTHINHPGSIYDVDNGECSSWIRKTEEGICNALTVRQWRNLLFRIGNKLY